MIAKVCDRCGQTFMDDEHSVKSEFNALQLVRTNADKTVNVRGEIVDICPECMDVLKSFLTGNDLETPKKDNFALSAYGYICGLYHAGHNFWVNYNGIIYDMTDRIQYTIERGTLYKKYPVDSDWEKVDMDLYGRIHGIIDD